MQTSSTHRPLPSPDPIARVRLWPLALLVVLSGAVARSMFAPFSSPGQEEQGYMMAVFATVIAWWLLAVPRPAERAGMSASTLRAVLTQGAKVAGCGILSSLLCTLALGALGLQRAGFVAAPEIGANGPEWQSVALVVLLVGVLAPIAEEMLFRGSLFRKWRLRWAPGRVALVTSAVFALGHAHVPAVFLHALAATVLYTTTRTLWAPIVAHVLNNLFASLVVHTLDLLPPSLLEAALDWRWRVAAAVPALLGTWWLIRFVRQGWHTLADPVHDVVVVSVQSAEPALADPVT